MFCPNCGKENQESSFYCEYCGARLEEEKDDFPQEDMEYYRKDALRRGSKGQKKGDLISLVAITVVALLIVGVVGTICVKKGLQKLSSTLVLEKTEEQKEEEEVQEEEAEAEQPEEEPEEEKALPYETISFDDMKKLVDIDQLQEEILAKGQFEGSSTMQKKFYYYDIASNGENLVLECGITLSGESGQMFGSQCGVMVALDRENADGFSVMEVETNSKNEVSIQGITASSTLEPEPGYTYDAANMIDHNTTTTWTEGADGYGEGEYFEVTFDAADVCGFVIQQGYCFTRDRYEKNSFPTKLKVIDAEGKEYECPLVSNLNNLGETTVWFPNVVNTNYLKFVIESTGTTANTKYDDTCVTEIAVLKEYGYVKALKE